jgi:8-oxo-dGTP pyrophosphatase MutT (NUDIX family)
MARIFAGLERVTSRIDLQVQVAAVCYRANGQGVEFLLVKTSSGKWTFPKGRLNPSMSARQSAAGEAWEEAGAKGRISEKHFGSYLDTKRALGHDTRTREVRIFAYLFEVSSTVVPEEDGRKPTWFTAREAKKCLADGRASVYASQIARIVDAALDRLSPPRRGQSLLLSSAQGRRLAPAR